MGLRASLTPARSSTPPPHTAPSTRSPAQAAPRPYVKAGPKHWIDGCVGDEDVQLAKLVQAVLEEVVAVLLLGDMADGSGHSQAFVLWGWGWGGGEAMAQ